MLLNIGCFQENRKEKEIISGNFSDTDKREKFEIDGLTAADVDRTSHPGQHAISAGDVMFMVDADGGMTFGTEERGETVGKSEDCEMSRIMTHAIHVIVKVSWSANTAFKAGSGELHMWFRSRDMAEEYPGSDEAYRMNNRSKLCGIVTPDLESATSAGLLMNTVIPDRMWNSSIMAVTTLTGTYSSRGDDAAYFTDLTGMVLGWRTADVINDPWPARGQDLVAVNVDSDSDKKIGITVVPRSDYPYKLPTVGIENSEGEGPYADEIYLATRAVMRLEGTRTSCTTATGWAVVYRLESRVIGCHVKDGADCTPAEAQLLDDRNVVYDTHIGIFEMAQVPHTVNCEEVRAALPIESAL